jgi:hypothetical protein
MTRHAPVTESVTNATVNVTTPAVPTPASGTAAEGHAPDSARGAWASSRCSGSDRGDPPCPDVEGAQGETDRGDPPCAGDNPDANATRNARASAPPPAGAAVDVTGIAARLAAGYARCADRRPHDGSTWYPDVAAAVGDVRALLAALAAAEARGAGLAQDEARGGR